MRGPYGTARHIRRRLAELTATSHVDGRRLAAVPARIGKAETGALGAIAALAGVATLGTAGMLGAAVVGGSAWLAWTKHRHVELQRRRHTQLPEALERMAAALRTGSSLTQAVGAAGSAVASPLGPELTDVALQAERGRSILDSLDGWVADRSDRGTRLLATALVLAAQVGATPARALDGVAATLRERLELAGERRALATQARASAVVLSIAPIGFALLLGATDSAAAQFLLGTTSGWVCLAAGLGLDALGAAWMSHLIRRGDA